MKFILLGFIIIITFSCIKNESEMKNDTFTYWIQRHDYSSQDFGVASISEAINAFNKFDWDLEQSLTIDGSGDKDCPAGIGISNGYSENESTKSLLHICIGDKNNFFLNLHYPVEKKYFGFIPYIKEEIYYVNKIPKSKVSEIIRLFYEAKFEEIINKTTVHQRAV